MFLGTVHGRLIATLLISTKEKAKSNFLGGRCQLRLTMDSLLTKVNKSQGFLKDSDESKQKTSTSR